MDFFGKSRWIRVPSKFCKVIKNHVSGICISDQEGTTWGQTLATVSTQNSFHLPWKNQKLKSFVQNSLNLGIKSPRAFWNFPPRKSLRNSKTLTEWIFSGSAKSIRNWDQSNCVAPFWFRYIWHSFSCKFVFHDFVIFWGNADGARFSKLVIISRSLKMIGLKGFLCYLSDFRLKPKISAGFA